MGVHSRAGNTFAQSLMPALGEEVGFWARDCLKYSIKSIIKITLSKFENFVEIDEKVSGSNWKILSTKCFACWQQKRIYKSQQWWWWNQCWTLSPPVTFSINLYCCNEFWSILNLTHFELFVKLEKFANRVTVKISTLCPYCP